MSFNQLGAIDSYSEEEQQHRLQQWVSSQIDTTSSKHFGPNGPPPPPPPRHTRPDYIAKGESYNPNFDALVAGTAALSFADAASGVSSPSSIPGLIPIEDGDSSDTTRNSKIWSLRTGEAYRRPGGAKAVIGHNSITFYPRNTFPKTRNRATVDSSPPRSHTPDISTESALTPSTGVRSHATLGNSTLANSGPNNSLPHSLQMRPHLDSPPVSRPPPPPPQPLSSPTRFLSRLISGDCPAINPHRPTRLLGIRGQAKNKWYAVIIGRRTGVFDDWLYVKRLTDGLSESVQRSYKNEDAAQASYTLNRYLMEVKRDSRSDEEAFGPMREAYDVNWRGY